MTDNEINRAIQYVTACTSYGRGTVADVIGTGLGELVVLATGSEQRFTREALFEYVCRWTIRKTAQPEPLVREVLGSAERWLDQEYERLAKQASELSKRSDPSMS